MESSNPCCTNCLVYVGIRKLFLSKCHSTIDDSQKIVLDNLPFAAGTKVEIKIHCVDEQRLEAARQLQGLFKELQALPSSLALTEEEIAEEVDAYRRGE